jgi:ataxia telangiectasia mutated family protein
MEDTVNRILKSSISQIPSYRLVPLTYQLFSRIDEVQGDDKSGFQNILRDVVYKICSEHPYHGIVQILALSNGQRIGGGVNGRHAQLFSRNVGTAKVDAVNCIIQDLRKNAPEYVSALIDSYQTLMSAYISLAEFDVTIIQKRSTKGLSFKQYKLDLDYCLDSGHRARKNTASKMPAIITETPPIRPDAQYGLGKEDPIGVERVISFEPTFDLTPTGLHRPKIVICIGSKGGRFKQLVKGEDDLRQDAIMQQVFGTVNDLLKHEGSSDSFRGSSGLLRRLRLITYGITPLSPTSGVLEVRLASIRHPQIEGKIFTTSGGLANTFYG